MLGLKGIKNQDLAALRFEDEAAFAMAARVAASADIPVDAPGRNVLIVRSVDEGIFAAHGLKFHREELPETAKISDAERSFLRRRIV